MPKCPHCKKNDKVFASAMFGKKDMACVRCKRTFRPMRKKKVTTDHKTIVFTRKEFKTLTPRRISKMLASGLHITVAK
jgi:tRNA(Ile2) C34 agmatinyltransferase TiaS